MPDLGYQSRKQYPIRRIAVILQSAVLLVVCFPGILLRPQVLAQSKPVGVAESPLCTRENAIEMIEQQIALTKTFNNTLRRLAVLIKAADLLWPYKQDKARVVFTEAFGLATENERELDSEGPRSIILRMQKPDQRYFVIRAVAKRDPAWARELTQQMLELDIEDREASSTRDSFKDLLTAQRLLDSGNKLIATDVNAALDLARASLNYPAGSELTRFLYGLAEVNQRAADQFYAQALAVYGDKPMREFLYLQAYPFAWSETLNTPIFASYIVPGNFVTSRFLQRQFVQVLLRRAQNAGELPLDAGDSYRNPYGTLMPGKVHLLHGLMRLEPQVSASLPDLLAPLMQAREKILVSLPVETQRLLLQPGREISTMPKRTFDEQVEAAQKVPDINERDGLIATAVLSAASEKESLPVVIQAIDQISDSDLRAHLLEWIYFQRAASALKDKQFEEAERLAGRVTGKEQRAYLHIQIAKALLNRSETQTRGLEVLDAAITEAKKGGMTIFAARALLTASSLYAKIDLSRSISVLADAIGFINRLEAPDFFSDDQTLEKTPVRRGRGGQYKGEYRLWFYMPGLDPESAFREMAKFDFDTALVQSNSLTDKFQRTMSTLGLAQVCLQQPQLHPKEKPKKKAAI